MSDPNDMYLYQKIKIRKEYSPEDIPAIPSYITDNLKYPLFDWQREALENFMIEQDKREKGNSTELTHLMFNLATGAGKTLLMAATILYYYMQGYRHFIFFVHRNNIVGKTENNFLANKHAKYLFKEKIVIDDKTVNINQVNTFSDSPQNIEIKFTSIHKLYNDIHIARENTTTLADLNCHDIVMLADEAHHLNTDTSTKQSELTNLKTELTKNTSKRVVERKGWEHTVIELILNKNGNHKDNKNVLLEFTATVPEIDAVAKKYRDKIIYKFDLKDFLRKGYTKEINLIAATLYKKERVLLALLFQWYRHRLALKHGIANFKPVILFRSKNIEDSESDYKEFLQWMRSIQRDDFKFLDEVKSNVEKNSTYDLYMQGQSRTEQVLKFIRNKQITLAEIAAWIKSEFTERNVIITNSKTNKNKTERTDQATEQLLNSLEDKDNHIRAIFTVERLTEGWDVLNLFDIVRLYEGRDEGRDQGGNRKPGKATIAEKQLIGRGVRYFSFKYKDKIANKRKFDDDLGHELRALEELYFHSTSDSNYIGELKRALKEDGYIPDDRVFKTFALKKDFQQSKFYQTTKIFYNERIDNPHRVKQDLAELSQQFFEYPHPLNTFEFTEQKIALDAADEDIPRVNVTSEDKKTVRKTIEVEKIERHIFLKAVNIKAKQENSLLQFERLRQELDIDTMDDFQKKLADFKIKIVIAASHSSLETIANKDKLKIMLWFLDEFCNAFKETIKPKKGTEFIAGELKQFFGKPKTKSIKKQNEDDSIATNNPWYVLDSFVGTSEEKALIEFIAETMGDLKRDYEEIYLLRNEEVYKLYDFAEGRGFQPDFILFLKTKAAADNQPEVLSYQILIEPKGSQYLGNDGTFKTGKEGWKEEFLLEISNKYGGDNIIRAENANYRLIGLPFFNNEHNTKFKKAYNKIARDIFS